MYNSSLRPNLLTFSRFIRVTKENTLDSCDELLLMLLAIRLNNWESQKRGPDNSSHMLLGVGLGNIKPALTNTPFFRHFCLDKQSNTALWNGAADELGASREPILDILGASEEISNTTKCLDARVRDFLCSQVERLPLGLSRQHSGTAHQDRRFQQDATASLSVPLLRRK